MYKRLSSHLTSIDISDIPDALRDRVLGTSSSSRGSSVLNQGKSTQGEMLKESIVEHPDSTFNVETSKSVLDNANVTNDCKPMDE